MLDDGLRSYLEELQESGSNDSEGAFTISWEQAREKLAQFALPDRRHYVLNLVAAAFVGGARKVTFGESSARLVISYGGRTFSQSEILRLWNHLLQQKDRAMEELAVALNTARRIPGAALTFESWNVKSGGCRLRLQGEEFQLEPLETPSDSTGWLEGANVVTLEQPTGVGKVVRWAMGTQEVDLVRQRACFTVPIFLSDLELNQPFRVGLSATSAAWRYFRHDSFFIELRAPNPQVCLGCARSRRASPGPFSAVLAIGTPEQCRKEGLTIILNGVTFSRSPTVLGYPVFSGVVALGHLRKNVSHTDLANNQEYHELLAALSVQCEELLLDRLRHPKPLPVDLVEHLVVTSSAVIKSFRARGAEFEASSVELWLKEVHYARNLQDQACWKELLKVLQGLEAGSKVAMALEFRLASLLRRSAHEHLCSGRVTAAVVLWGFLVELAESCCPDWEAQEREVEHMLRCLAGLEVRPKSFRDPDDLGLVNRLLGKPKEALLITRDPLLLAQACLAVLDFERAEEILRSELDAEESALVAETLCDLLMFSPFGSAGRRSEALFWKKKAVDLRAQEWTESRPFFADDLDRLGASGLTDKILSGMGLNATLSTEVAPLLADLEVGRLLLLKGEPGVVNIKSTLLAAERKWSPNDPILQAARAKAVYILRSAQLWREADDILARAALFARVESRMRIFSDDYRGSCTS